MDKPNKQFELLVKRADKDLYCWRCVDIGLQEPTIYKGDNYYYVNNENNCCYDCLNRLREQLLK